jgi:hypothetical protein
LRPPRALEPHRNTHDERGAIEPCLGTSNSAAFRSSLPPKLADKAHEPFGPDPHLQRIRLHIDTLDQELEDPRLLGGNSSLQSLAKSASRTVTSTSVISSSPSRLAAAQVRATPRVRQADS